MENPTKKQYPDLMGGKTPMYVRGFMLSSQPGTVTMLRELLPRTNVVAGDLPVHPTETVDLLKQPYQSHKPDLVIGTSIGGMYTEMLTGYDRILVNPAFQVGLTMYDHGLTGKQSFHSPRRNGETEVIVTRSLVNECKYITEQCFANVTPEEQRRMYGLFGNRDPLVHTFDLSREHYPQVIRFHGAHRVTDKVAFHYLIPVICQVDDQQEGRGRPIVYIGYATLHDSYGKVTSSMYKTYKMLIERCQIYIVTTAPINNHAYIGEVQAWVEEYLSTPAYNRVIFTNQSQLLYGDYLITPEAQDGFMGTCLAYRSGEFKTQEELIVYFGCPGRQ